jgi:hypothetical protein
MFGTASLAPVASDPAIEKAQAVPEVGKQSGSGVIQRGT